MHKLIAFNIPLTYKWFSEVKLLFTYVLIYSKFYWIGAHIDFNTILFGRSKWSWSTPQLSPCVLVLSGIWVVFLWGWALSRFAGENHLEYLTIIPRARMGSESIAQDAEGRMGYWLRGDKGERNNCFSKIQLVGQYIATKQLLIARYGKTWILFLPPNCRRFSLLVGYNI